MKKVDTFSRYHRQMLFPGWGRRGQARLKKASLVQVGCGGIGSTLAQCLVRAGVKKYTIIDKDRAELSNLHRQLLFDEEDARKGVNKALAAARKLRRADSTVQVVGVAEELGPENVNRLLAGHDLVLDASDNMETRFLVNEWCVAHRTPWIYGGVIGACGMILVILPGQGPCLRCVFPDPELSKHLPTTATAGILNTAPPMIATLQATEAIKLILGSPHLIRELRVFDLWTGCYQSLPVQPNPHCPVCGGKK